MVGAGMWGGGCWKLWRGLGGVEGARREEGKAMPHVHHYSCQLS